MTGKVPKNVGEIDAFVKMLVAACEDETIHGQLEKLLSMPDEQRRALVHTWVNDMLIAKAPTDFVQAVACLMDDRVAEKAYEAIFHCRRAKPGG